MANAKIFGIDLSVIYHQLIALVLNVLSWVLSFNPIAKPHKKPVGQAQSCIQIHRPGGLESLQEHSLEESSAAYATVGYNVTNYPPILVSSEIASNMPDNLVLVNIEHFSINYADICIRWGLYESALKFVGWPIVPGFDLSGTVLKIGAGVRDLRPGDKVFGFTLFGAYSSRLLVPAEQIRRVPPSISMQSAAALPAVAATALHAISLAGGWPMKPLTSNKAVLVHSAAGGVGSMLLQMLKLQGFGPIVAVVGGAHKRQACLDLGATHVIDKSNQSLWAEAERIAVDGYVAVFDANGVETLKQSYNHLSMCGKLVVYGFHSNLPKENSFLSPIQWVKMAFSMGKMPTFDAMDMTLTSKSIAGFNLSFFANELELMEKYLQQIIDWAENGAITVPQVTAFDMCDVGKAHELMQSGRSVGKLVIRTRPNCGSNPAHEEEDNGDAGEKREREEQQQKSTVSSPDDQNIHGDTAGEEVVEQERQLPQPGMAPTSRARGVQKQQQQKNKKQQKKSQ